MIPFSRVSGVSGFSVARTGTSSTTEVINKKSGVIDALLMLRRKPNSRPPG